MTPAEFRQMMERATGSVRRANATNREIISPTLRSASALEAQRTSEQAIAMRLTVAQGIRPTTDESKLNKTEKAYLVFLEQQENLWLGIQCLTFKLGHDCRYTPDFAVIDVAGLRVIDVKGGHTWEDSLIKMRTAARLYPWVRFVKAQKKGSIFEHQEIKP